MSAEAPAMVRSWRVGRYTCTLTMPRTKPGRVTAVVIEWSPEQPEQPTPRELEEYRAGRDAAIAELGLPTVVVDL